MAEISQAFPVGSGGLTPNYKMMERWGRFGSAHIFKIDLLLSQDLSACSCPCDLRYPPHSTHPVSDLPGIAGTECLPDSLRQVQGRFYFISYHVFGKSVGVLSPDRAVTSPPPSHLPTTDLICPPLCWGGYWGGKHGRQKHATYLPLRIVCRSQYG